MKPIYVKDCGGYVIQTATEAYIPAFMAFFGGQVNPDALLAHSFAFIKKQFYDENRQAYNILIAVDKSDGCVCGALAFVDTRFYDPDAQDNFVWLTNWVSDRTKHSAAGLQLLNSVFAYKEGGSFGTVGNNEVSGAIYEKIGFQCGFLKHFYMTNNRVEKFLLLKGRPASGEIRGHVPLRPYQGESLPFQFPFKSVAYMKNKYIQNPFYHYNLYRILDKGLLVIRTDTYAGKRALRIVDFIGEADCLAHIGHALQNLLRRTGAEYVDFYCRGIPESLLRSCGFSLNTMDGRVVVPSYFEPYRPVNVPIAFCCRTEEPFVVLKGDGDRDFPRIWNE